MSGNSGEAGVRPSTSAARAADRRVHWRGITVFVLIAYALMWLATIPFWISPRGLSLPGAQLILIAVMFAPALASFVVCRFVEHRPWLSTVGIRSRGPVHRIVVFALLGFGSVTVLLAVLSALSVLFGVARFDLLHFSGVAAYERALPVPAGVLPSPGVLLLIQVAQAVVGCFTINAVSALGEESGWRGYLLCRLLPLGRTAAIVITGLVWGLWHLPLILLGYEYPGVHRPVAVLAFLAFCVGFGALLAWLRLRSGSVIPCAVAHGTLNAWAGIVLLLFAAGAPQHPLLGTPQGVVVILGFAAVAVLLFLRRPATGLVAVPTTVESLSRPVDEPARPPGPIR